MKKYRTTFLSVMFFLSASFCAFSQQSSNIEAIPSFLSSENFIYISVLSLLGFVALYRLFRKN
ncbi:hypothetical protein N9572_04520 [Flavobacteriaceae bacterium]|nr:hypothetical protein [Flavobacteriaceae bacterium]